MQAILNNPGQITIPEPIRRQLHLQPGDTVEVVIGEVGEIKLLPVVLLSPSSKGCSTSTGKAVVARSYAISHR